MWDLDSWELLSCLENHTGPVWALPLGDGVVLNGNTQGEMKVWRYATLEEQVDKLAVEASKREPTPKAVYNLDGDDMVTDASAVLGMRGLL